jgi:hypothetical protein
LLADGLRQRRPCRLVLAKYQGADPDLVRVEARLVEIKGEARLSVVHRYRTRDVTSNLAPPQALQQVEQLLRHDFRQAHIFAADRETQLTISKRGKGLLRTVKRAPAEGAEDGTGEAAQADPEGAPNTGAASAGLAHNRSKRRPLSMSRPFLQALGVTDRQGHLIPAMARKWKQINRFIEVFAGAWNAAALRERPGPLRLIDFGSGKGYLTFALHDYLRDTLGIDARMTGVELRADLVTICNDAVARLGIEGLAFSQGDITSFGTGYGADPRGRQPFDVMIALHACDTATDDAIHQGIRAGAAIILCAPCCHKQVRPQLLSPHPLRPILRHGVHLGQEAEMLTDGLRALLLEACGYDTQVFEFISLEHTSKNKMILAVKRTVPRDPAPVLAQIGEIKAFYGIREQRLESLLAREGIGTIASSRAGTLERLPALDPRAPA